MKENIDEPEKSRLLNYLHNFKNKEYGKDTVSLGELETWCESHSEFPDIDNLDEAFVQNYFIDENDFRIFVTTRRLLCFIELSNIVTTDATYKLVWQGFPCIVVGVVDNNKSFHPVGFSCCDSEDAFDYEFVFNSLKKHHTEYNPKILVGDNADAITCGFKVI